jgi:hypothetical protein
MELGGVSTGEVVHCAALLQGMLAGGGEQAECPRLPVQVFLSTRGV